MPAHWEQRRQSDECVIFLRREQAESERETGEKKGGKGEVGKKTEGVMSDFGENTLCKVRVERKEREAGKRAKSETGDLGSGCRGSDTEGEMKERGKEGGREGGEG